MWCDLNIRRSAAGVNVKNKLGKDSILYPAILAYVQDNNILPGREWFFKQLVTQNKLQSYSEPELALGLYSLAWHSGRSEGYWLDKVSDLLPEIQNVENNEIKTAFVPAEKLYENFIAEHTFTADEVIPMFDKSEYYKELVRELIKFNPKLKVVFTKNIRQVLIDQMLDEDISTVELERVYNYISPDTEGVAIYAKNVAIIKDDVPSKIIIHEMVHLTIESEYDKNPEFASKIDNLYSIAKQYVSDNKLTSPYGLTSVQEFIAEGLSNPEFMRFVNEIPSGNSSVFSEFMKLISNFINQLFSISVNPNSVLAELADATNQIIEKNKSETQTENLNELVDSFDQYFPQYEWLSEDEKTILLDLVDQGKIELSCKI